MLLLIAGVCYLFGTFANLVFPVAKLPFDIMVVSYVSEIVLCLWLIVRGVSAEWPQTRF